MILQFNYLMQYIKSSISVFVTVAFLSLVNSSCFGQNYSSRIRICGNSIDEKSYTTSDIKSLLKGEKSRWKNGNRVILVIRFNEDEKSQYLAKEIYNKSTQEVRKFWLGLVFSGRFSAPLFADSNEEVLMIMAKHKGAIGVFVDCQEEIPEDFKVPIIKSENEKSIK